MCVSTSPSAPVASTSYRDTSEDPIVSNYELSDAQKKENQRRRSAKNKAKSLVSFNDGDNGNTGAGVPFSGSSYSSSSNGSGFSDASGGFRT